ncbi:MAG: siroheme synthase [Bacteroidetes bacterium SW_9_63_38]|nr:MAG: siroheme synthase [Bacteroidetes bacterium SW_9_63_38]
MTSYPVYITNLDEQRAFVVGSGPAAERKVEGLLDADARVTLIAPDPPATLREWAHDGRIDWVERSYEPGDLEGAALVIVTASGAVVDEVWAEAQERNVLVNTTGDDEHSTFANGACIRRGPLVVSISTSGAAPTVSVRLREQMADRFGPEYEAFLEMMDALREPMQAQVDDFETRRDRWYQLVDSDLLDLLRNERYAEAQTRVQSIVGADVAAALDGWAEERDEAVPADS